MNSGERSNRGGQSRSGNYPDIIAITGIWIPLRNQKPLKIEVDEDIQPSEDFMIHLKKNFHVVVFK